MWCLGAWFSGGFGSIRFIGGLDYLKGLFQPKLFYDSIQHPFHLGSRLIFAILKHC